MAKRIQRKRVKGWKMPPNAIYVGRPSEWGNPYKVDSRNSPAQCVDYFRMWITSPFHPERLERVRELRGKDLACWCPLDKPCHADVLLELANK